MYMCIFVHISSICCLYFIYFIFFFFFFFFFQAEDGIRDKLLTGVQTCALPISTITPAAWKPPPPLLLLLLLLFWATAGEPRSHAPASERAATTTRTAFFFICFAPVSRRSEERRVGKECRSRRSPYH